MISFKMLKPVLALGDACPDILIPYGDGKRVLELLKSGVEVTEKQKNAEMFPGGAVANTASGISRLGGSVMFCGTVGNDRGGRMLKDDLTAEGVDVSALKVIDGLETITMLIVLGTDGDRMVFAIVPEDGGSHFHLDSDMLDDELVSKIGWVHTTGMMLRRNPARQAILKFMEKCYNKGVVVSFDLNLRVETDGINAEDAEFISKALQYTNVILGSGDEEIVPLTRIEDRVAASKSLVKNDRIVVCRNGKAGSTVYTDEGEFSCGAFDVPVLDTTGAGDSFNSGFISALSTGETVETANVWGNAVACYNIMRQGARNTPTREKLQEFLAEYKGKFVL